MDGFVKVWNEPFKQTDFFLFRSGVENVEYFCFS